MAVWSTLWSLLAWGGLVLALWRVWLDHRALPVMPDRNLYRALALCGLVVTWTFMLIMAAQDMARYPGLAAWSAQSNLFFDAYRRVTETPAAWWWSSQLMLWAPAAVLFFHAESIRQRLSYWAYVWVGMCVAISVALPLFLLRREAHGGNGKAPTASAWVALCLSVAAAATVMVPVVQGPELQWCLLALHAGVLLALLPVAARLSSTALLRLLYAAFAIAATLCWWNINAEMWLHQAQPASQLWNVVWSDPAQSSISLDLVLTVAICMFWAKKQGGGKAVLLFFVATTLLSLGSAFCIHQLWRLRKQA